MSDTAQADKLVKVYIKMRDKKEQLTREYESQVADIKEKMDLIESELLELCKATGQDGGRTAHGTFTRKVSTRYWTSDWGSMTQFIKDNDALELYEQRIHQGNMKSFLQANPGKMPPGLNADSRYSITVRRATT